MKDKKPVSQKADQQPTLTNEVVPVLPKGSLWPGFWMYQPDPTDATKPELDILEAYSGGGNANSFESTNGFVELPPVQGHEYLDQLNHVEREFAVAKRVPIFMCERNEKGGLTFTCPYCKRKHHHKDKNGHRKPHCFKQPPMFVNGYFVVSSLPVTTAAEEQAEMVQQVVPVERIHRTQLRTFLEARGSLMFAVDFIKLDKSPRSMVCRFGVKAPLKGGKNTVMQDDRPYLTVYDMSVKSYRTVNLATVYRVRADRKVYDIVD